MHNVYGVTQSPPKMILSLSAAYIRNHRLMGQVGWLFAAAFFMHWSSPPPLDFRVVDAITSGCGYVDGYMCTREGCFYNPTIIHTEKKVNIRTLLGLVHSLNISHATRYNAEVTTLTDKDSIECALNWVTFVDIMPFITALIPAMVLSFVIIVLLVVLQPSSDTYVIGAGDEDLEMYSIGSSSSAEDVEYERDSVNKNRDSEDEGSYADSEEQEEPASEV